MGRIPTFARGEEADREKWSGGKIVGISLIGTAGGTGYGKATRLDR